MAYLLDKAMVACNLFPDFLPSNFRDENIHVMMDNSFEAEELVDACLAAGATKDEVNTSDQLWWHPELKIWDSTLVTFPRRLLEPLTEYYEHRAANLEKLNEIYEESLHETEPNVHIDIKMTTPDHILKSFTKFVPHQLPKDNHA